MEKKSQNTEDSAPAVERKAWIEPEFTKVEVESGFDEGGEEAAGYVS